MQTAWDLMEGGSATVDLVIYTSMHNTTGQNGSLCGTVPLTIIYFRGPSGVNTSSLVKLLGMYTFRYRRHYFAVVCWTLFGVTSSDFGSSARKTSKCQVHDIGTYFRIPDERVCMDFAELVAVFQALLSCFKYIFLVLFTWGKYRFVILNMYLFKVASWPHVTAVSHDMTIVNEYGCRQTFNSYLTSCNIIQVLKCYSHHILNYWIMYFIAVTVRRHNNVRSLLRIISC